MFLIVNFGFSSLQTFLILAILVSGNSTSEMGTYRCLSTLLNLVLVLFFFLNVNPDGCNIMVAIA